MLLTFRGLLEPSASNFEFLSLGRREQIRDLCKFHRHIDRDSLGTMKPGHWLPAGDLVIASKFLMLRGDGRQANRPIEAARRRHAAGLKRTTSNGQDTLESISPLRNARGRAILTERSFGKMRNARSYQRPREILVGVAIF